jgi:hypothetical protein
MGIPRAVLFFIAALCVTQISLSFAEECSAETAEMENGGQREKREGRERDL